MRFKGFMENKMMNFSMNKIILSWHVLILKNTFGVIKKLYNVIIGHLRANSSSSQQNLHEKFRNNFEKSDHLLDPLMSLWINSLMISRL